MPENVYYKRLKELWESLGYKNASVFARELGSDRGEKIKRLERKESYQPSIDLIGDILKRFPVVNPLWLISGLGDIFIAPNHKILEENSTVNKVEEPCPCCEKLKAEKMQLLEKLDRKRDELDKLNEDYRHLLENGLVVKKETTPEDSAQEWKAAK